MKKNLLKQPAGALIAVALVVLGGAGVYAATNWFNGRVTVKTDNSVMTVNLSRCESNLPPGIEPNTDRSKVKFKIVGTLHISTHELERKLLVNCEFDSVLKVYQQAFGSQVGIHPAILVSADTVHRTVTLQIRWGGVDHNKTFSLATDTMLRDKGQQSQLADFTSGDTVMIAYTTPMSMNESDIPFEKVSTLSGIFKTQYDTREFLEDSKSLYDTGNIMPLDLYNQIHK